MKRFDLIFNITILGIFLNINSALADQVSLPVVPQGNTSFVDGVSGPGGLYEQSFGYYYSNHSYDDNGKKVSGRQKIRVESIITHLAYITEHKIFGGYYGSEIIIPVVHSKLDIDNGPDGSKTRMGDIQLSPLIIQWAPQPLWAGEYWQRFNLTITTPTGDYSQRGMINTGDNLWQINPHYAFTWMFQNGFELSGRIHYSWFGKNTDTQLGQSIQPGSAIHTNLSLSYEVQPNLRLGVAGYTLNQLQDDKIDGHSIDNSKEQIYAVGPGVMYKYQKNIFYLNVYKEFEAKNTSMGTRAVIRYMYLF